jgi:hypothetical protein
MLKYGFLIALISVLTVGCRQKTETIDDQNKRDNSEELVQDATTLNDSIGFYKELSLQNIFFKISATGTSSKQKVTIETDDLQQKDQIVETEIEGRVVNAEIEDLNLDGYPEILIYTVSAGSGSFGNVIGYSVTNENSIDSIYFPEISQNPRINKGYKGHDNFVIVETNLNRSFQLYNERDSKAQPTGYIRQIQYKLVDGEDSKKFVTSMVLEYPKN